MNDTALLDQKQMVDSFLGQGPRLLSSFNFTSIFAWGDFFEFEFRMSNGCLCIFARTGQGCFLYLPPLGKMIEASTIEFCFKHMAMGGRPGPLNRIENIPSNLLSAFDPGSYNQYIRPAEYVYLKEDLAGLKGNAYKSQRHECNVFKAHQAPFSFGPYQDADLRGCRDLYERWSGCRAESNTDEIYRSMLQENRQVHERLLKHLKPLGLVARVLKLDGKIIGYTFGYGIDQDTFCVYAEVADLKVRGAAAYLFNCFCRDQELRNFSRINTMDDFAMPKVARAKQAYHPSERIYSYSVTLKKAANP